MCFLDDATELWARMMTQLITGVLMLVGKLPVPFCFRRDKNPLCDGAHRAFQRGSCPLSSLVSPTLPLGSCTPATLNHHRSHPTPDVLPPTLSQWGAGQRRHGAETWTLTAGTGQWRPGVSATAAEPISLTAGPRPPRGSRTCRR